MKTGQYFCTKRDNSVDLETACVMTLSDFENCESYQVLETNQVCVFKSHIINRFRPVLADGRLKFLVFSGGSVVIIVFKVV